MPNTRTPKTYFDLVESLNLPGSPRVSPIEPPQAYDDVDNAAGLQSVEDPANLDRLNGFLATFQNHQFINPYFALHKIWVKLQIIGLNFDVKSITFMGENGVVDTPLTQFGGRYGFLGTDGQVSSDDGISNRIPGGLKLRIYYIRTGGVYTLTATIVPGLSV